MRILRDFEGRGFLAKPVRTKKWLKILFIRLPLWFCIISIGQVLLLRWIDPPASSFMAIRAVSAWLGGNTDFRIAYDWRDLQAVSTQLPIAVVASEDQRFPTHHGFDFESMRKAYQSNRKGRKTRGASTISQQLAKNLFLWSGRSYARKALEAWYTLWIELLWPKRRILEVYVNVAEFGDGVYGAQAASMRNFGKPAKSLSRTEAARLAAVLPSPRRYSAKNPGPYVQRRTRAIERQIGRLGGPGYLHACCAR
ncbi:MAG: monofunctional biosynthetic peptidoglycan transglycosylase [Arenimonas sp.]|nr:monofunctional biosynthetic peptidoglycan transglycosylase [Arenimonas sp.]